MSQVKHRGVRRGTGSYGVTGGPQTYDYVSPGVTLPNEDPKKWEELHGPVIVRQMTQEERDEMQASIDKKKRARR